MKEILIMRFIVIGEETELKFQVYQILQKVRMLTENII